MLAQKPDVTGYGDGGRRRFRDGIFVGLAFGNLLRLPKQRFQFRIGEAHDIEIEIALL